MEIVLLSSNRSQVSPSPSPTGVVFTPTYVVVHPQASDLKRGVKKCYTLTAFPRMPPAAPPCFPSPLDFAESCFDGDPVVRAKCRSCTPLLSRYEWCTDSDMSAALHPHEVFIRLPPYEVGMVDVVSALTCLYRTCTERHIYQWHTIHELNAGEI